jgi:hypothetical protein
MFLYENVVCHGLISMSAEKDRLRLAVNLDGKIAKRFLEIQEKLGIKTGTDVVRFLINRYYDNFMLDKTVDKKVDILL